MNVVVNEKFSFSKMDTAVVKGIAIIAMIIHHIIPNNSGLPVDYGTGFSVYTLFGTTGKVCVVLFTILSGYGLSVGYNPLWKMKDKAKYTIKHVVKLYFSFWYIFFVVFIFNLMTGATIKSIYGSNNTIRNLLFDFFGVSGLTLTGTMSEPWWYMEAIIIFYCLFPVLYELTLRLRYLSLIIFYIPWIYYILQNNITMHTDREVFYLFPFVVGILMQQKGLLDGVKTIGARKPCLFTLCCTAGLIISIYVRSKVCLPYDTFLGVAVIVFCCLLSRNQFTRSFFSKFGKYSSMIFMFHGTLLVLLSGIEFRNYCFRIIVACTVFLGVAQVLEQIKKGIKYKKMEFAIITLLHLN